MLSRKSRMLDGKYDMRIHVRGHEHARLQISIVAMCLETQLDVTRPTTTLVEVHVDEDRGA